MDIQTLRFNAYSLKKLCNTESNPVLLKHYKHKYEHAAAALASAKRFDSAEKPSRTPWKRLQGPSRYFEQV